MELQLRPPLKPHFDPDKTIFLIDGSAFLYRAYYGLRPMHTSYGLPVQAVYNFCRIIHKLLETFKPKYMAIVWDSPGKTERHELLPTYKATRQAPPSDLFVQKEKIMEFADLIQLKQVMRSGVEADDLMYSIGADSIKKGDTVVLVTSDKDMGQMVGPHALMYDWLKEQFIDVAMLEEKYGFPISKIPFYFALIGDASDNIPGVKGIGKVGAAELVTQFDSLDDLYKNLDKVKKERTREALAQHKADAFLSQDLFLLRYHDLGLNKEDFLVDEANWPEARPLFEELEFKSLLKDLEKKGYKPKLEKLSELKGYNFLAVTHQAMLKDLVSQIHKKKLFAFDTETDGLDGLNCNLVGISICVEPGTAYYIPVGHQGKQETQAKKGKTPADDQTESMFGGQPAPDQIPLQTVIDMLKPVFEDTAIKKYLQHTKFDQLVLSQYGIHVNSIVFDTLIAAHLVTEDWQRISLKYLSQFYLKEKMISFADAVMSNGYKSFAEVPLDLATEYAAADAHQTYKLVSVMEEELRKQHMEKLFYDIELPLAQVLYKMEKEGIYLDASVLHKLNEYVERDMAKLEEKIIVAAGEQYKHINLNSPKQLSQLLFHDLKLPPQRKTRTGYSTDEEVLEVLAKLHPVPGLIIKWRELAKLKSTYLDSLPTYINPKDGRIHTSFSQTSVSTGRLASSDPNLQNIPVHTKPYDIHVRMAFKPEKGHVFLSADYSQIELRVLAFLSGDEALIHAFNNNIDIHTQTAAKLFDVPLDKVTNEQRQLGKRINFSILYGMTPYGLSQDLGISYNDAKTYIEKYFAQYPGVSAWMERVIEETKKHGYVTTHWGRRRYVPGIYERNRTLYDLARRIAINTAAQGTAAEVMKIGMINLDKTLSEKFPGAKILLQIHDELLISVPKEHIEQAEPLAKKILETVVSWPIPMVVDTRIGSNWQEVTK